MRCCGICHHLLDKGIVVQSLLVNHFAVDDTPLCQILPNLFRVNIVEGILLLLRLNLLWHPIQRTESMIPAKNREGVILIRLHCLHTTLPLRIEAFTRQGCVPQGLHHNFIDFPDTLRVC